MRYFCAFLVAVSAIAFSGCDERLSDIAGPTPSLAPTFASVQRDVFEAGDSSGRPSCVTCHTTVGRPAGPAGGFSLEHNVAYGNIVNAASSRKAGAVRIIPGDPENSYLIRKVEGRADILGLRMPFNGPFLSDGQILILRRWVELGAPAN